MQVPPFRQGPDAQSSTSVSQVTPMYPGAQAQVNESTPSVQVPPFRQGAEAQSSTSVSQVAPT